MYVTTADKVDDALLERAQQYASEYNLLFVARKRRSVAQLFREYNQPVFVVGKQQVDYYETATSTPLFFHPNAGRLRIKSYNSGQMSPFLAATELQRGHTLLDGTLGLGSDALFASYIVGATGKVVATEAMRPIWQTVDDGLKHYVDRDEAITSAMRRVEAHCQSSLSFLRDCATDAFDVIYVDPMFEQSIAESDGLQPLKALSYREPWLTEEWLEEAKRVAKRRIVMKNHYTSPLFTLFPERLGKKSAVYHYGIYRL